MTVKDDFPEYVSQSGCLSDKQKHKKNMAYKKKMTDFCRATLIDKAHCMLKFLMFS